MVRIVSGDIPARKAAHCCSISSGVGSPTGPRRQPRLRASSVREMIKDMNNYQVTRCQALLNNTNVSSELRMIAEALVAMASGIDDADSMAQQALERIDIVAEHMKTLETRLAALEQRAAAGS
jgi:hypothetical protein